MTKYEAGYLALNIIDSISILPNMTNICVAIIKWLRENGNGSGLEVRLH